MEPFSDKKIIESWVKNVAPWVTAVQQQQITSRRLVTDQAIIDAVMTSSAHLSIPTRKVLDIGCGEGWLARELSQLGLSVTGLDVLPEFIREANKLGGGDFRVMAYEEISAQNLPEKYDVLVCNFSLIGKESVEHIFRVAPSLLNTDGIFAIQTLHPVTSCGQDPYRDGWRAGSWAGFSDEFCDPAPWYFRTLESWFKLFRDKGYRLRELSEPINPETGQAASLIMIASVASPYHQIT
ncbi:MAG: methyltransferase domain-containing protein [Porticoccaceae bacterium]|nr:methyltransferase domain-containing protein [Porticoccaceae bacterium]